MERDEKVSRGRRLLHIAADAITDERLAYLGAEAEKGKTHEGTECVAERGRMLREFEDRERRRSR
jgi:hypothetical protein